jgi:hypothetical protein
MIKQAFVSVALLALPGCAGADDDGGPGNSATALSAAAYCELLFNEHLEMIGNGWSTRLTGGLVLGGSTHNVASIESCEGFFEVCGRSNVTGSYVTSSIPFTDDYTMTLSLESTSCGNKTVLITGDCRSGNSGTASWNGQHASVAKVGLCP